MHRLLQRQLRKTFPDGPPAELGPLLEMIDAAYTANDEDRALLERAMELTGEELMERNAELAARVEELEEAQEGLRQADILRRRFINAAAHELGTPLTPIKMQVHALKIQPDPQQLPTMVSVLERNVDRLVTLVSDLLDSAKLQNEAMRLRPIELDASAVARGAVASMAPWAHNAGIKLSIHAPEIVPVVADLGRLGQVLDNLISNAIKFTPAGGSIHVRVEAGDWGTIRVTDTGRGLDPDDLGRLFQPFVQLHQDLADAPDGTGLGLYISRGIVEACGGSIVAASDGPGRGATFTVRLPSPGFR